MICVETRVIRKGGGAGYVGMVGVVVEMAGERARVLWDDELVPNFYDPSRPPSVRKGKRTWVNVKFLAAAV